jgi:MerR family mercuric resistance operon transcriptional regulator
MASYLRNQMARKAGVNIETLRYYERKGLIVASRSENGYRRYSEAALDRLRFICRAKEAGFTLEEIRKTLDLFSMDLEVPDLWDAMGQGVSAKIEEVEKRIDGLTQILALLKEIRKSMLDGRTCSSLEPLLKKIK